MIAVVYSKTTGRVRRIVVSTDYATEKAMLSAHAPAKGEETVILPEGVPGDLVNVQGYVTLRTGLAPADDRYAVVDAQGEVLAAITACPDCDDLPADKYVKHAEASKGWKRLPGGEFEKPVGDAFPDREIAR